MMPRLTIALRCLALQSPALAISPRRCCSQLLCAPVHFHKLVTGSGIVSVYRARLIATRSIAQDSQNSIPGDDVGTRQLDSSPARAKLRLPEFCSGCGVRLQQANPDTPGYFQTPKRLLEPQAGPQPEVEEGNGAEAVAAAAPAAPATPAATIDPAVAKYEEDLEQWLAVQQRPNEPDAVVDAEAEPELPEVLCTRCYSLRHYGKIKSSKAEALLPVFDLGKKVGRKIALQTDRRAVVLCVVDVTDFDGSLPRLALRALLPPGTGPDLPQDLKFKLMVAVNKVDLLPTQVTQTRLEQWVRARIKQAGLPRPDKVFIVSAVNGSGVPGLADDIREALGLRADLWVVGAQNAGKSSLISAMKRLAGTAGKSDPTIAAIPGTTLGLLRVPGLPLGPKHRAFDTPGVPHDYQLTTRLNPEELKHVLPRRRLKLRTYRLGPGQTVLVGGLARLDVLTCPGPTLYLTLFASDDVTLHMGKTETAGERWETFVGSKLTPPHSAERWKALGPMESREVVVTGDDWKCSTSDIAIAGLGWIAVGVNGSATFRVWTPKDVAVTTRNALVPDYAKEFQRPGFSAALPQVAKPAAKAAKRKPSPDFLASA